MSEVKLSYSIMTVPEREDLIGPLLSALDVEPHAIIEDRDGDGLWPTARRAWESHNPLATHHLVLQDDVVPVPHLIVGCEQMLDCSPGPDKSVVSLFGIKKVLKDAYAEGYSFLCGTGISWAQGLILPTPVIGEFLAWCDEFVRPDYKWDDARLSLFCLNMGYPVYTTIPCLLEHLDVPSTVGNPRLAGGQHERRAAVFTGESALSIKWKAPALHKRTHSLSLYDGWEKEATSDE